MGKLNGKVAVVTGASKGIGAAIAEELAREGASVVVNYASSGTQAEAIVSKIEAAGGTAKAVRADVSKPAEAKNLVKTAVSEFGKVDILVNNAGVYEFLPLESITEKHFDRMFDLNVRGLVFATQAAAGAFGDAGGSVINIGSVASQTAPRYASVYSATKGAVDVITKSLGRGTGPQEDSCERAVAGSRGDGRHGGDAGIPAAGRSDSAEYASWPGGTAARYRYRGLFSGVGRRRMDHRPNHPGGRRTALSHRDGFELVGERY